MPNYWEIFKEAYSNYAHYLWNELLHPHWGNYFYALLLISAVVYALEIVFPWRKNQGIIRKDFWLDGFYMLFNFFLFSLILYNGLSEVAVNFFNAALNQLGINNLVAIEIGSWPTWTQWITLFILTDFVHWNIHRLLHRVPWLWKFHQVHHSVKEMGFAAHLRFHWMETVVYKSLQYIPLSMIGFGIDDFFVVHIFALTIGHLNHANLGWDYGPLKFLFNNPKMHIWHHAKDLPNTHRYGVNFGLSLSVWDYLFGTAYIPKDGRDISLGYPGDESMPNDLPEQLIYPLTEKNNGKNKRQ